MVSRNWHGGFQKTQFPLPLVPVMVPMSCLPFILWSFARIDLGGHADVAVSRRTRGLTRSLGPATTLNGRPKSASPEVFRVESQRTSQE